MKTALEELAAMHIRIESYDSKFLQKQKLYMRQVWVWAREFFEGTKYHFIGIALLPRGKARKKGGKNFLIKFENRTRRDVLYSLGSKRNQYEYCLERVTCKKAAIRELTLVVVLVEIGARNE